MFRAQPSSSDALLRLSPPVSSGFIKIVKKHDVRPVSFPSRPLSILIFAYIYSVCQKQTGWDLKPNFSQDFLEKT